jgi:glycosyltransferase involved in cell wall biosynthesis
LALASIVVPFFNERRHIAEFIERVWALPIAKEVMVVDEFSTDGMREILAQFEAGGPWFVGPGQRPTAWTRLLEPNPRGLPFAVPRQGRRAADRLRASPRDVVCIQDPDLEYHPSELLPLIEAVRTGAAECAFGSRFLGGAGADGYLANRVAEMSR